MKTETKVLLIPVKDIKLNEKNYLKDYHYDALKTVDKGKETYTFDSGLVLPEAKIEKSFSIMQYQRKTFSEKDSERLAKPRISCTIDRYQSVKLHRISREDGTSVSKIVEKGIKLYLEFRDKLKKKEKRLLDEHIKNVEKNN